jgi:hypothetical protein
VDLGHDTNHPSPIDPDPLMHVLGIAMLHYTNLKARAVVFAQLYSFKAGLKKFGDVGETAAMTELTQLHTYETYHPVHTSSLSPKEPRQALASLMNIVENPMEGCKHAPVPTAARNDVKPDTRKEMVPPHSCHRQHYDHCHHRCPRATRRCHN